MYGLSGEDRDTITGQEYSGREVIQQAMDTNPELFQLLYTELLNKPTTEQLVTQAIGRITEFLHEHVAVLFAPIFSYLRDEGELRSMTDIDHFFARHYNYG